MGKIPIVERRVMPSGQGPYQTQQPDTQLAKAMMQFGDSMGKVSNAIGEIDNKVKQIEQSRMKSDSQLKLQQSVNDIRVRHLEDPNLDNSKQYYDELQQSTKAIVNSISDPYVKDNVSIIADGMVNSADFSMKALDVRRNAEQVNDNLEVQRELTVKLAVDTNDPQIIATARANYLDLLNNAASLTGQSKEWVDHEMLKVDIQVEKSRLYAEANVDADIAIAKLDSGEIKYIDDKEQIALKKSFISLKKTQDANAKNAEEEIVLSTQRELTDEYLTGQLDGTLNRSKMLEEIRLLAANKDVSPGFASQFEKLLKVDDKELKKFDPDVYADVYQKWFKIDQNNNKEVDEYQAYIISKIGKGLPDTDAKKLLLKISEVQANLENRGFFGNMFNAIKQSTKLIKGMGPNEIGYDVTKAFADKVDERNAINNPKMMEDIATQVMNEARMSANSKKISAGDADFNTVGGVDVSDLRARASQTNKAVVVKIVNGKVVPVGLTDRKKQ